MDDFALKSNLSIEPGTKRFVPQSIGKMNAVFHPWRIREFRERSGGIREFGREDTLLRCAGAFFGAHEFKQGGLSYRDETMDRFRGTPRRGGPLGHHNSAISRCRFRRAGASGIRESCLGLCGGTETRCWDAQGKAQENRNGCDDGSVDEVLINHWDLPYCASSTHVACHRAFVTCRSVESAFAGCSLDQRRRGSG